MTINLLSQPRSTLEKYAPGFDMLLQELPFVEREAVGSPVIDWFKERGPLALLVPLACEGQGADLFDAVQVQIALGARSPSLAVASTMHQFSVASLVAITEQGGGAEGLLLSAIAQQRLLLASGFAEGNPGGSVLDSNMSAVESSEGVYLSGSKKPCSLGLSMDLLTASYTRHTSAGDELMIALIPARSEGIQRRPYWGNSTLAAAQSVEVHLEKVFVGNRMIFSAGPKERLGRVQTTGFVWFELLISAAYLGACLGLVEGPINASRGSADLRLELASQLQLCLSGLEGIAGDIARQQDDLDCVLARLLLVRYGIEQQLERAANLAQRLSGGQAFITHQQTSLWADSCRGLAFHPPGRLAMGEAIDNYLNHGIFKLA